MQLRFASVCLLFLLCPFLCPSLFSSTIQIEAKNIEVKGDSIEKRITIDFDLLAAETDTVDVSLVLLKQDGHKETISLSQMKGDVGFPVYGGQRKRITWNYGPAKINWLTEKFQLVIKRSGAGIIQEMLETVDTARIRKSVNKIYGARNYTFGKAHLVRVGNYIYNSFLSEKLACIRQLFYFKSRPRFNVIGNLGVPTSLAKRSFIVSAHYDTYLNSPGADDNALGVAGMLEAMRIMSKYSFRDRISFVAFDAEEPGSVGSSYYVKNLKDAGSWIGGVFNFDMIGRYSTEVNSQEVPDAIKSVFPDIASSVMNDSSRANFVLSIANESSAMLAGAFNEAASRYLAGLKVQTLVIPVDLYAGLPELRSSDQVRFWDRGIPALHIGEGGVTRNPHVHSNGDTIDHLDYEFTGNVVKMTIATIAALAGVFEEKRYTLSISEPVSQFIKQ